MRKSLEKALGGKDLSDQKVAIKDLIEARFDAINSDDSPASHGVKDEADDEIKVSTSQRRARSDDDDGDDDNRQPAKKHKRASSAVEDADARLAAELQAQENRLARSRTTRGASTSKPVKRANAKKKSAAKVKDDGSDSEGGRRSGSPGAQKEKRKAGGGFQKPYNLSPPLAELLGVPQVSRMQVVKLLWVHIKAHQLQDPTDKRQILCDDLMQAVFKQPKIDMFQMNKQLGHHLYPVEEE